MAEENCALRDLARKVPQDFRILGGRVFAREAEAGRLDRQTIELKCEAGSGFMGTEIRIGTDTHPWATFDDDDDDATDDDASAASAGREEEGWRLSTIPTIVSVYPVDEAWIAESAERHDGTALRGMFDYHPAGQSEDAKAERPMATAWVAVGPDTFRLIRDELLAFKEYSFSLGLDLHFPEVAVENGFMGRTVKWDGNGQVPIVGLTVLWKREDWSPDFRRKRVRPTPARVAIYEPSREQRDLLDASGRIEASVAKLLLPLWLIAGAIVAFLIFRH